MSETLDGATGGTRERQLERQEGSRHSQSQSQQQQQQQQRARRRRRQRWNDRRQSHRRDPAQQQQQEAGVGAGEGPAVSPSVSQRDELREAGGGGRRGAVVLPHCTICHGEVEHADEASSYGAAHHTVARLNCGHTFHAGCVWRWFRRDPRCPNCRGRPEGAGGRRTAIDATDDDEGTTSEDEPEEEEEAVVVRGAALETAATATSTSNDDDDDDEAQQHRRLGRRRFGGVSTGSPRPSLDSLTLTSGPSAAGSTEEEAEEEEAAAAAVAGLRQAVQLANAAVAPPSVLASLGRLPQHHPRESSIDREVFSAAVAPRFFLRTAVPVPSGWGGGGNPEADQRHRLQTAHHDHHRSQQQQQQQPERQPRRVRRSGTPTLGLGAAQRLEALFSLSHDLSLERQDLRTQIANFELEGSYFAARLEALLRAPATAASSPRAEQARGTAALTDGQQLSRLDALRLALKRLDDGMDDLVRRQQSFVSRVRAVLPDIPNSDVLALAFGDVSRDARSAA